MKPTEKLLIQPVAGHKRKFIGIFLTILGQNYPGRISVDNL
jgi:hypothetical protein